jgi:quinol monooxygenase YgiN
MKSFHELRLQIQAELQEMPGYIWSIDQESGEYAQHPEDPRVLINMSTWHDRAALAQFMRLPAHQEAMRRTAEWFVPMEAPTVAIWEADNGHQPTVAEGLERLKPTKPVSSQVVDSARDRS